MDWYTLAKAVVGKYSKGRMKPENAEDAVQYIVMKLWEEQIDMKLPYKQLFARAANKYIDWLRMNVGSSRWGTSDTKPIGKEFHQFTPGLHDSRQDWIEDYVLAKLSILNALNGQDKVFVEELLQGSFLKDIGRKMGYSESRAAQILKDIREDLAHKFPDYADK